jgi:DNA-binding transcriptional MerR regulator
MSTGGSGKGALQRWLSTGEMARLSGTTLRTVRFYEAEGLITSRTREDGTHRKFPERELHKLQLISDLREAGLSLQEIKDLIALKAGCPNAARAASEMTANLCERATGIARRIEALQRVHTELSSFLEMLRVCKGCTHPQFPAGCGECEVTAQPGAERANELFWKN